MSSKAARRPSLVQAPLAGKIRLFTPEGESEERQGELLPRFARRTREVDAALAGLYLSGTNTRRVKQAPKPLLKGAPSSKSAVSRVVTGLKDQYETWRRVI